MDAVTTVEDPRAKFLLTWVVIRQARLALVEQGGTAIFSEQQPRFVQLIDHWGQRAEEVGKVNFPPELVEAARDDIDRLAAKRAFAPG